MYRKNPIYPLYLIRGRQPITPIVYKDRYEEESNKRVTI